jgi:homoserine O-acetyltransferase
MTAQINENSVGIVQTQFVRLIEPDKPLKLQSGKTLAPVDVAYETYGRLNQAGDNAILICHALSGDAHVAGFHSEDDTKPGWWDIMVGPGKGIDTEKYFVICSNFLGGCAGTTGPGSVNPETSKPYGLDFPIITIADMVKVQKLLLDRLGIKQLLAVIGGSIGGMQVLQWAIEYPDFVKAAIPIATTTHLGAQSIAFDAVGRNAILADADFAGGNYSTNKKPDTGLGIARMIGHITYLSEEGMRKKFGRQLRNSDNYSFGFDSEFAVETYLDHQGRTFVERFDANSYLYITKAADYFDLNREFGSLPKAFENTKSKFLVISFSSDWLFTPVQSEELVNALAATGKDLSYCCIESPSGHDAFLLENEQIGLLISGFLDSTHRQLKSGCGIITDLKCDCIAESHTAPARARVDYQLIESLIEPQSTVLDVGCGDGQLLARLIIDKNITATGIEIDHNLVTCCIRRGLSTLHRDIELGLQQYADNSFDYAILSQTLQTIKNPEKVLTELLRVGAKVIVSFPNFAHWRCRKQLFLKGKAPVTAQLPYNWDDTPNIHCLSLKDFDQFCKKLNVKVEKKIPLAKSRLTPIRFLPNLFAEQVIYVTTKG